jgi:hypothetical protein
MNVKVGFLSIRAEDMWEQNAGWNKRERERERGGNKTVEKISCWLTAQCYSLSDILR